MKPNQNIKVIWDGFGLTNQYSGVARHANWLSDGLSRSDVSPLVFGPHKSTLPHLSHIFSQPNKLPMLPRSKLAWSRYISSDRCFEFSDQNLIYHGLCNFNIPLNTSSSFKRVITIHDIIPIIAKGMVSRASTLQLSYLLPKVLQAADKVICVSKWTRDTIIGSYPSVADKTVVIPNGFLNNTNMIVNSSANKSSKGQIIHALSVMRYEPYKRFDRLLDILNGLDQRFRLSLVTDAQGEAWIKSHGKSYIDSGRLSIGRGLSDSQLSQWFANCDFLLHTSEYEGFCLPAAQAIAASKPVIFKAGSGIDEVVGPAGLGLGDCTDEWVDAISSGQYMIEKEIIAKHISQQKTWASVAIDLKQLYNKLTEE